MSGSFAGEPGNDRVPGEVSVSRARDLLEEALKILDDGRAPSHLGAHIQQTIEVLNTHLDSCRT